MRQWKTEFTIREALAMELYNLGKFNESLAEIKQVLFLAKKTGKTKNTNLHFYSGINQLYNGSESRARQTFRKITSEKHAETTSASQILAEAFYTLGYILE